MNGYISKTSHTKYVIIGVQEVNIAKTIALHLTIALIIVMAQYIRDIRYIKNIYRDLEHHTLLTAP